MTVGAGATSIGASVLEQHSTNSSERFSPAARPLMQQQGRAQHQEPRAAPLPSLLRTLSAGHKRLLLLQPTNNGDNEHSLAMDLALSLASGEACRCGGGGGSTGMMMMTNDGSSSRGTTNDLLGGGCENCVAVTLVVPAAAEQEIAGNSTFPLLCRRQEDETQESSHMSSGLAQQRREAHFQTARQRALQRIQVRHVSSLSQVWEYLLSLPGRTADRHPVGGIVLAGLDRLASSSVMTNTGESNSNHAAMPQPPPDAAVVAIRMTQTVAILMDTVSCLHRMHGHLPTAAVTIRQDTTMTTLPKYQQQHPHRGSGGDAASSLFRAAGTFWSPVTLRVLPATAATNSNHTHDDPDEVAVSHWTVVGGENSGSFETTTAQYTVVQNLDHEQRIVWWANDRDRADHK